MICDCCGGEYADNYLSCPYCGTATAVSDDTPDMRCPRCSAPMMQGQPMCQQCGFALDLYQQRMQNMYSNQPPVMPNVEYDANGQTKMQNQYNPQGQYYGQQGQQYNRNWYNDPQSEKRAKYFPNTAEDRVYNPNDTEQAQKARIALVIAIAALILAFIAPTISFIMAFISNTRAKAIGYKASQKIASIALAIAVLNMYIDISL